LYGSQKYTCYKICCIWICYVCFLIYMIDIFHIQLLFKAENGSVKCTCMYVHMNVFIGNFKTCSCQCHIIQATAVGFQRFTVIVKDEQNAEGLFGPKNRKQ
jgi:hypothetical protein